MIPFSEALNIVKHNTIKPGYENVPLSAASGRYLAETIYADRDTPPFNKSAVDGFACRGEDLGEKLEIVETIPAGYLRPGAAGHVCGRSVRAVRKV